MRNVRESYGITLIALVITVIVLLILAGVTILAISGENGIIQRAVEAREETEEAKKIEQNTLNSYEDTINEYTGLDWDRVLANAEKHPDQKTSTAIGVGTDGRAVNMDLWEFEYDEQTSGYALNDGEVLNNTEYGGTNETRIRNKGYNGNFSEESGEIIGTVPAYIKEEGSWIPVTSMYNTFYNCTDLQKAPEIPSTVVCMWSTYQGCAKLKEGKVGSQVINLWNCFMDCTSLTTSPILPNTVKNMMQMFYRCTELNNVSNIPNSVTSLQSTFYGCTKLESVPDIPNNVITLSATFQGCTNLKKAPKIGKNVEDMYSTFGNCTSLVNAPEIPNNVKFMRSTFNKCINLQTPPSNIPNSVINIYATFDSCAKLEGTIEINANITDEDAETTENYGTIGEKYYKQCFSNCSTSGNGLIVTTTNEKLRENDYAILKNIINTKASTSNITLYIN